MIKYADIKGYKDLGEVSHHLYQWIKKDVTKGLPPVIVVRAYDTTPKIFKGIILSRSQEYYSLEITEDLSELESFVGELEVVTDLKDLSEDLKGFKLIEAPSKRLKVVKFDTIDYEKWCNANQKEFEDENNITEYLESKEDDSK